MADNLQKRPSKGILKNSSSFDKQEASSRKGGGAKETKWDEMNIIATLHPPDKDYGHMKIDEPKTPYNYANPDGVDGLDAASLKEKIKQGAHIPPKALLEAASEESDEEEEMTLEEKAKKREFESKRKKHYNEFYAVKLARRLLEDSDEDSDEDKTGGEEAKALPEEAQADNTNKQSCSTDD